MTTDPKHRRLSFMDGLVLAIAAGEKTVTRRIVKGNVDPTVCEPEERFVHIDPEGFPCGRSRYMRRDSVGDACEEEELRMFPVRPPYDPDDILDVCEVLVPKPHLFFVGERRIVSYRADGADANNSTANLEVWPWKVNALPARYCPAWAVRHHRRILNVRPERLSAVTDAEAVREGVARLGWAPTREGFLRGFRELHGLVDDADPWVWRIEFSGATS